MANNQQSNQSMSEGEDIHVMPSQYFGARGDMSGMAKPSGEPGSKPSKPGKKRNVALILIVIFGLLILIVLVAWLIYLNFESATQEQPQNTTPVTVTEPEPEAEPEPEPQPEPEPEAEEEAPPLAVEPIIPEGAQLSELTTTDTDGDGLTDAEEFLLETDETLPDTDSDSYLDGSEVINLYNPLAETPAQLELSDLVTTYVNPVFGYDVFYPQKWIAQAVDRANVEVMFTSSLGEFVSIRVEENPSGASLTDWYLAEEEPELAAEDVIEFVNKNDITGIESQDGFKTYFSRGRTIYVITYSVGLQEEVSYPNLYKMMVESFVFTAE